MYSRKYEIVTTKTGAISIKSMAHGEIMHNPVGPQEACQLYSVQSKLEKRLHTKSNNVPLVLYDVGLGAGFNSLSALDLFIKLKTASFDTGQEIRDLHIYSFECDLDLFKFSQENVSHFEKHNAHQEVIKQLIANHKASGQGWNWTIFEGNFVDRLHDASEFADLIFFDPYSPEVNKEMWRLDVFKKLFSQTKSDGLLLTYSCSTAIRTALLLAGYYVGVGDSTGLKSETTAASPSVTELARVIPTTWLDRWQRSSKKTLEDLKNEDDQLLLTQLINHPQFKGYVRVSDLKSDFR